MIILEQFLQGVSTDLSVWLKERKPNSAKEVAQMADDYVLACGTKPPYERLSRPQRLRGEPAIKVTQQKQESSRSLFRAPLSEVHNMLPRSRKVKVHSDKFSPLRVHRQQWDDLRQRDHGIFQHGIAVYQRSYRCRCTSRIADTRQRPKPCRPHHANACVHKSLTLWPSYWDPHTSSITDRFMSKKMPPPWGVQFPLSLLTYT